MPSAAHDIFQRHRLTVADYYRMVETGILAQDTRPFQYTLTHEW